MQFSVTLEADKGLKKKVDDIRYHYDRKLLKERYPYIHIFGPFSSYINLKQLHQTLSKYLKNRKRFRCTTDIFGFLETEKIVFLNIFNKGELKEIYDFICEELKLYDIPFYFPHIIVAKHHSLEILQSIYEELKDIQIKYSFLTEMFHISYKEDKEWEDYSSILL